MTKYRNALPQLNGDLFLTDGGIETTMMFHEGLDLPHFAAFHLLKSAEGMAALYKYFISHSSIARRRDTGLILESATWRASPDWGQRLGYSKEALAAANRKSIHLLEEIRREFEIDKPPVVISGCVGPRGDGYIADERMSPAEAEGYHAEQIGVFAGTAADMICAITMNYSAEATGIARAAREAGMPVAISFTVETNGNLPTGQPLQEAIAEVDALTDSYPAYYMINCAHPTHFHHLLLEANALGRIHGLRANASTMSHAELNESTGLDAGNPVELGLQYAQLRRRMKNLNILGGCCGTDHRHIDEIAKSCIPQFSKPSLHSPFHHQHSSL